MIFKREKNRQRNRKIKPRILNKLFVLLYDEMMVLLHCEVSGRAKCRLCPTIFVFCKNGI